MKIEDLELVLKELKKRVKRGDVYYADYDVRGKFNLLIRESLKLFPDKKAKLEELRKKVIERNHGPYGSDILDAIMEIQKFLDVMAQKDIKEHILYT